MLYENSYPVLVYNTIIYKNFMIILNSYYKANIIKFEDMNIKQYKISLL